MRLWQNIRVTTCAIALGALALGGCSGAKSDDEALDAEPEAETTADEGKPAPTAEPAAATAKAEAVATPQPASAPAGDVAVDPTRVVRFVNVEEATIHGSAQDGGESVGKLLKGDRVLVVEQNGWGRIADGMFIKLDGLSKKAVPRHVQPAVWTPPVTK